MATYFVGAEGAYHKKHRYKHGDKITLDDDEKPSRTFFPADNAAKRAFKKFWPEVRPDLNKPDEAAKDSDPKTLSEASSGGHSSSREPV